MRQFVGNVGLIWAANRWRPLFVIAGALVLAAAPAEAQSAKKGTAQKGAAKESAKTAKKSDKTPEKSDPPEPKPKPVPKKKAVAENPVSAKNADPPAVRASAPKVVPTAAAGAAVGTASAPPPAAAIKATDPTPYAVVRATHLAEAPDAGPRGELKIGTPVEILARDRGWVRVRTEGWVKESDLTPADTAIRTTVGAADLRSAPDRFRGVMLKWNVQYLAFQTADTLRHGLSAGEPYMLARGPGGEDALVYLAVPNSLVGMARALSPLSKIVVVARVRSGRSEPAGVPVLDVQSLQPLK